MKEEGEEKRCSHDLVAIDLLDNSRNDADAVSGGRLQPPGLARRLGSLSLAPFQLLATPANVDCNVCNDALSLFFLVSNKIDSRAVALVD